MRRVVLGSTIVPLQAIANGLPIAGALSDISQYPPQVCAATAQPSPAAFGLWCKRSACLSLVVSGK